MSPLDFLIGCFLLLSIIVGLSRGFAGEITTKFIALVVFAILWPTTTRLFFERYIPHPSVVETAATFVGMMILTIVLMKVLTIIVRDIFVKARLGLLNTVLGGMVGLAKAIVIAIVVVGVAKTLVWPKNIALISDSKFSIITDKAQLSAIEYLSDGFFGGKFEISPWKN